MKLLPETPRTARRSSKPSALSATPSTKVPTTNKTYQTFSAYTIEESGRKIGLMAQILLHGTLHATVYEVDKLKIGGGNFLTKISLLIILQWYQRCLCYCLLQTENKPN
ncbi:uncharacterized protein [Glycine max]|nr:uncharacterized protein LOC102670227 isoform X4 [Glycine max]